MLQRDAKGRHLTVLGLPGTHALCTQVAHVALAASLAFRDTPGISLKQELALGPV